MEGKDVILSPGRQFASVASCDQTEDSVRSLVSASVVANKSMWLAVVKVGMEPITQAVVSSHQVVVLAEPRDEHWVPASFADPWLNPGLAAEAGALW